MFAREQQRKTREHREKAAGCEQPVAQMERWSDNRAARGIKSMGTECLDNDCAGNTIGWQQRPRLVHKFGKFYFASMGPWALEPATITK
jgi:hypothetical protein